MKSLAAKIVSMAAATVLLSCVHVDAHAQSNKILGVYKSWIAQTYTESGVSVCMMWSQPEKAEGDYTRRGEIYIFVSHRPGEQRRNEIRFEAGYSFKGGSKVDVRIDSKVDSTRFVLVTDASTAWLTGEDDESAMVRAMQSGRSMQVGGTSSRGTRTLDTYSLYGFTAAYKAINKACS